MTRQLLRSPALTVAVLASMTGVWACKDSGGPDEPTPVPTTVTLSKTAVSLDAIGATDQLSATVRDQNGNTMSTASVSWASNDQAVATVSASGLVAAVANGTAQVTATSGSANGSATVTVAQVPAQVQKAAGDAQTGTVGQALTDLLYARVNDRLGNAISGVTVNFAVSANGGVVSPTSGATGADGRVGTEWTLGTLSGSHSVTATPATGSGSADFTATADPEAAAAISEVSGSGQTGLINTALANPLVVAVVDQFDNGVPGVGVTFSTSDGLVSPTNTTTDASGQAQATWTLGSTIGAQTAQASSPGLTGDPVTFTATGTDLSITTITPDTIVEGASATITGTG
ncbi:MAG: hypothetical protein GTN62_14480, partial [Gemmatimonadales bacterium]|nr:hypothetical protein [Gemmatimonadales bacterium]NIN13291.1 hypothetical protein [Gemmatimonadales bacterium]NIN51294.1 hypothetical protein [Gemmatimonadales bacterium]NIP08758.1 hypothetical protein [Gemmatimonadales bacterium]NIQ99752.1 hypothetical protein [Gemmatimonadales bacterium]